MNLVLDKIVMPKAMETQSRRRLGVNNKEANDKDLMALMASIASGDTAKVRKLVTAHIDLAQIAATNGASRAEASRYFFPQIRHYVYAGDTALHIAAAGFRFEVAQLLIDHGANPAAKNRRGAEPLHYASDSNIWNPAAQVATIECLVRAGANPNSTDKSGVAPIHRAVRTRCAAAVQALLLAGAKPDMANKNGSTPLHLAVQNTGRSGSGTPEAVEQQRQIILLLPQNGTSIKRKDGSGKTVDQATTVDWIRKLLRAAGTE
jgi:Ankyrin repeats (many copies)